jgi:phage-related protein
MSHEIVYYSAKVQSRLLDLPSDIVADYLRLIDLLSKHGPDLRLPHSRAMGGGLFELRPRGKSGIARVFYCMQIGSRIVILHSFTKKTQKTPPKELGIAMQRLREVNNAH